MQHLRDQADSINRRIFKISDPLIRYDLRKFVDNLQVMITELSREAVECRRLNSLQRTNNPTTKFLSLSKEIEESIYRLEKYLTMYSLLG